MGKFVSKAFWIAGIFSLGLGSGCGVGNVEQIAASGQSRGLDDDKSVFDTTTLAQVTSPACSSTTTKITTLQAINTDDNSVISTATTTSGTLTIDIGLTPHFALQAVYSPNTVSADYIYYAIGSNKVWQGWGYPNTQYLPTPNPATAANPWPYGTGTFSGGWVVSYYKSSRGCQLNVDLQISNSSLNIPVSVPASVPATTDDPGVLPAAPALNTTSVSQNKVSLGWTQPASNPAVSSYTIQRSPGGWSSGTLPASAFSIDDATVSAGKQYTYTITSTNAVGPSMPVSTVVVTPAVPPPPPPVGDGTCQVNNPATLASAQQAAHALGVSASNPIRICLGKGPYTDSVDLWAADSGEIWQSATPPTGLPATPAGLSEINGRGSKDAPFILHRGAHAVTFNGLYIHDFTWAGILIWANGGDVGEITIKNNYLSRINFSSNNAHIHDSLNGAVISQGDIPNFAIQSNMVTFTGCFGFNLERNFHPMSIVGNTFNYTGWYSQSQPTAPLGYNECAAIYLQESTSTVRDPQTQALVPTVISANHISNWHSGVMLGNHDQGVFNGVFQAVAIELDFGTSYAQIMGNFINPPWTVGDPTLSASGPLVDNGHDLACVQNNNDPHGTNLKGVGNVWSGNSVAYGGQVNSASDARSFCHGN